MVFEDHTHDQYIGRPILQRLVSEVGRPHAQVHVVTQPRLRGFSTVRAELCWILRRYGPIADAIVVIVDRDCTVSREEQLGAAALECEAYGTKAVFVCAVEELEVWALWGSRSRIGCQWSEVRSYPHPKERFFEPLLLEVDGKQPGGGRSELVERSLAGGWRSLIGGCPELGELEARIRMLVT